MSMTIKITRVFLVYGFLFGSLAIQSKPVYAAGTCGTGTWTSGNLEIHHINIGQGDSTLIVGTTGKSLLFDTGESNWNSSAKAQIIGSYIEGVLGCKSLDYVVISHFHLDHIGYVGYGGLWHLVEVQGFTVGTTLVRDYNTYLGDISGTFTNWKTYLEGIGQAKLNPVTASEGTSQVNLGTGVTFNIVTHDGNGAIIAGNFSGDVSPPSENDYSIGVVLSYGNFDEWIGGDLDGQYEIGGFGYTYHDIELSSAPEVGDVDIYKVNHHASSHSSSTTFVNQLDPEVSIVTVGDGNTYGHPTQSIMDLLLTTSTVYMTERGNTSTNIGSAIVAGHIVIKTSNGSTYTVNGTTYTATEPLRTDTDSDGYFAEVDPADNNPGSVPLPNGGCGPIYQTCSVSCQVTAGQVLINEVLPAPSIGPEWVELYNTTTSTINLGYCYVDDIVAGSASYQIPAGTIIPAHGFWTLDRTNYFNNTGDDVRFLKEDAATVMDSFTYGNTGSDVSWYRFPDGGNWAASPTASTTKGQSNGMVHTILVNSVLPTSRSIPVGTLATIFNTIINAGADTAYGITLSMNPTPPGTFVYQQTDCATNAVVGTPNSSLDLAPGGVLCYVLSFTPSATFAATSVHIQAQAINAASTNLLTGINTWLLRATSVAGPDIIALTTTTDFHQVACSGANAFAVALSNVGAAAAGDITAVANTGTAVLPLSISISETDPATGVVIGDHILQSVGAGENRTVAVFVTFNGCIAFDPAANRIFIEFRDASNNVVGSTSTAVSTGR